MSVPTRTARSEAEFVECQCAVAQPVAGTATIFSCSPRLTAGIYRFICETAASGGQRLAYITTLKQLGVCAIVSTMHAKSAAT